MEIAGEDIDSSRIEGAHAFFASEHMQRSAAFGASLGENQSAVGKVEGGEGLAAGEFRLGRAPMQTAGNHQVKREPEVAIDSDNDAFPNSPQFPDGTALHTCDRRLSGS